MKTSHNQSPRRLDELGSLQQAVMESLWTQDEATVEQVRMWLPGEPAYTTVLSVLQKLEKAGWVGHRPEGRTYVYAARRSREQEGASSVWSFVDGVSQPGHSLVAKVGLILRTNQHTRYRAGNGRTFSPELAGGKRESAASRRCHQDDRGVRKDHSTVGIG